MEWRPIPGYEGVYDVSDEGDIRRIGRAKGARRSGRILHQTNHAQGYKAVSLNSTGLARGFLVHRLVAMAFLGPIPGGHEVNHKDGDKKNNVPSNLEYMVRRDNLAHAVSIGLIDNFGPNNPMAKLTYEQAAEIRREYTRGGHRAGGPGYKALGTKYGVSWEAIRNIIKGRVWLSRIAGQSGRIE